MNIDTLVKKEQKISEDINNSNGPLLPDQRIQPNENKLLTSIDAIKEAEPKRTPKRVFGMESTLQKAYIADKLKSMVKNTEIVNDYLQSEKVPIDEDGNKLINYSEERGWFFDNVSFIFSTGFIFDEDDTNKLDMILRCFQNSPNKAYLKNRYFILDYNNPVVQKIETLFHVSNGNYRILAAVVVSAEDSNLINAPSYELSHKGVNRVETSWNAITDLFTKYLSSYGFIAEYFDKQDIRFKNEQRLDRKNYYNAQMNQSPVDLLNSPIEKFEAGGKKSDYNEREFRQYRTAKTFAEDQRGKNLDVRGDFRKKQGESLYDRINNEPIQAIPSKYVGAHLRMDDAYLPNDEVPPEYIIYNDLDTYDKSSGKNFFMNMNPDMKREIPNFSTNTATIDKVMSGQKTTRNAKGGISRTVVGASPLVAPK